MTVEQSHDRDWGRRTAASPSMRQERSFRTLVASSKGPPDFDPPGTETPSDFPAPRKMVGVDGDPRFRRGRNPSDNRLCAQG